MANLLIKDVFEELSEENDRLLCELRYCRQLSELFDKYRQLMIKFNTDCVCNENQSNKTLFSELEVEYMTLKSLKISLSVVSSTDPVVDEKTNVKTIVMKKRQKTIKRCIKTSDDNDNDEKITTTKKKLNKLKLKYKSRSGDNNNNNKKRSSFLDDYKPRHHHPKQRYKLKTSTVLRCQWTDCDYERVFPNKRQLVAHVRSKHTKERPYKCLLCDKSFVVELYLKNHMKITHPTDGTPVSGRYQCQYSADCQYCTKSNEELEAHHLRHQNLRPYKCDVDGCDKSYFRRRALDRHKRCVHTDDRPFGCEWPGCESRFKDEWLLNRHKKIHGGLRAYRCDYEGCNKSYNNSNGLLQHKNAHRRPYVCSWPACEARFAANVKLKDHMNEHQGLKPHECQFDGCDARFTSKQTLRYHWRHIHHYIKSFTHNTPKPVINDNNIT